MKKEKVRKSELTREKQRLLWEDLTVYIPASVTEIEIDKFGETHEMEGNIKIITTAGSYAEEYAKEYGVEYEIVDGWD